MPPLKPRHDIPVPPPTEPSPGGSDEPREASAAWWAARTSSGVTHMLRTSLRKESSHSATTGTKTSSTSSGRRPSSRMNAAPRTRRHDPRHEVWVGVPTEGTERADRVDAILDALVAAGHEPLEATPQPDEALAAVHDPELLRFLRTAAERWASGPYAELVGQ